MFWLEILTLKFLCSMYMTQQILYSCDNSVLSVDSHRLIRRWEMNQFEEIRPLNFWCKSLWYQCNISRYKNFTCWYKLDFHFFKSSIFFPLFSKWNSYISLKNGEFSFFFEFFHGAIIAGHNIAAILCPFTFGHNFARFSWTRISHWKAGENPTYSYLWINLDTM